MRATNARYGWRRDKPDFRDQRFTLPRPTAFPPIVDLRPKCPPVLDQGDAGSCVANATSVAIDFEVKKMGLPVIDPSRLFIYYLAREVEGSINSDSGCEIRDAMKCVGKYGVAPESMWPYDLTKLFNSPPAALYDTAMTHLVQRYYSVPQLLNVMKSCIAAGFPFIFGFTVYDSFESDAVANTGIVPMPQPTESVLGGHAVMACGFNDNTQRFYVQNSWGTSWGQKGFFEIPYGYLQDPNLAADMWTIRLVEDLPGTVQQSSVTVSIPGALPAIMSEAMDSSSPGNIKTELDQILKTVVTTETDVDTILQEIRQLDFPDLWRTIVSSLTSVENELASQKLLLDQILNLFSDPAVALQIKVSKKGATMAQKNLGLTLQVFENGQATASLTPVDAKGNATTMPAGETVPAWTVSDPSISLSASADGLSCLITAGAVAVTGATVTATATSADGTSTLTGTSDPFDIVPQPPGAAVAFKIVVQ